MTLQAQEESQKKVKDPSFRLGQLNDKLKVSKVTDASQKELMDFLAAERAMRLRERELQSYNSKLYYLNQMLSKKNIT